MTLDLPPLRDRKEDVPDLARHFLAALNEENSRRCELTEEAVTALAACRWTGNVRQLRNCLERAVVTSAQDRIAVEDVCPEPTGSCRLEEVSGSLGRVVATRPEPAPGSGSGSGLGPGSGSGSITASNPDGADRARVVQALARCGWVQAKAARLLGMTVRQLRYRVQKYGIALEQL